MADNPEHATDATPIKPVSSLRSRFENLGQEQLSTQPSPVLRRGSAAPSGGNAQAPSAPRPSLDIPRPNQVGLGIRTNPTPSPQPRNSRTSSIDQRPFSMVDFTTRQPAPPAVTIDSPRSPPKQLSPRLAALKPSRSTQFTSPTVASAARSPNQSPVLPGRPFANRFSASQESLPLPRFPPNGASSPRSGPQKAPPVNRAGKPRMSPSLGGKPVAASSSGSDKKVSPFSTPPSSSEGTPNETSLPPTINERSKSRTGSLVPARDSYFQPPPVHHAIQERKQDIKPVIRASTLPAHQATPQESNFGSDGPGRKASLQPGQKKIPASGRTSPIRPQQQASQADTDRSRAADPFSTTDSGLMAPPKRILHSATEPDAQHFTPLLFAAQKAAAPAPPAPRRSLDTRRSLETRRSFENRQEPPLPTASAPSTYDYAETAVEEQGPPSDTTEYPNPNYANRRPPHFKHRPWEIFTGYETKLVAVCGEYVCTSGYHTKVWSIKTGNVVMEMGLEDTCGAKVTAIAWKPAKDVVEEGRRLWLGNSNGDILEVDITTRQTTHLRRSAHPRSEIIRLYRFASSVWSLDDQGKLHTWRPGVDGMPSLDSDYNVFRVPNNHTASTTIGEHLWYASGKDIRVFRPNAASDQEFQVLQRPFCREDAGDVTSAATIVSRPNEVYFGHTDGKVSVYDRKNLACVGVYNVSVYKISALVGVGDYLWAGYTTGMAYVYDTKTTPWIVKKVWRAHQNSIASFIVDQSSIWKMDRLQVVTLGTDNALRIWDGMLEKDWQEDHMRQHDEGYCDFDEITAAVMTWNAGASKPAHLQGRTGADSFFRDYLTSQDPPDIFVFGFQELVDLEYPKVTAKSIFKSKRKDPSEQEHMSHQYRAWRDHLVRCIDEIMPSNCTYTVLHTASLVGLFSCIFVKSTLRGRISNVSHAEVKRGMGGLHGNKGALIIRMVLDDSSVCFVNCHLAAGQNQTTHRNNDISGILESENLPVPSTLFDTFTGGGDGSMILDHEICILNGDLNYRIDAMTRDNVVRSVKQNDLTKLLDRDQLLRARKRNPGFRLRLFQELPITFAPTYKYNVNSDDYDTSEKKRAPAWCDRLLYRGMGRIKCTEYRRWELRVSDHRPVSGRFKIRIKSMDQTRRQKVLDKTLDEYDRYRETIAHHVKLDYLVNVLGLSQADATRSLRG